MSAPSKPRAGSGRGPVSEGHVVAIDGPSGVGKSSIARELAARLGLPYLDTGAMYRCLGLEALRRDVDLDDEEALARLASEIRLDYRSLDQGAQGSGVPSYELLLNGEPVGESIRSAEVSLATSALAKRATVRTRLVELQRRLGRGGGVVEGRDIGTAVFPETPFKIFLDAHLSERARRRFLQAGGDPTDQEGLRSVEADLAQRDRQDSERELSPLRCDDSYFVVDTTELTPEQVLRRIESHIAAVAAEIEPA